jgi:molybdate transport system substrate-binding protein
MTVTANEFRMMTSGAFTAAHLALIPQLERLTKKKVVTASTSIGMGENSIPNRLKRSEVVDIVIVAEAVLRQFIEIGLVLAEGHAIIARSSIAMAVRAGAPKPRTSGSESHLPREIGDAHVFDGKGALPFFPPVHRICLPLCVNPRASKG